MNNYNNLAGIRFILTSRCNYDCIYCHREGIEKNQDNAQEDYLETIEELIKEGLSREVKRVSVTGGEPFLSKKLFPLLKIAKKYNQKTTVNTNGSLLAKYIDECKDLVDEIHIHLPSLKQETYQKLVGTKKASLSLVLKNISELKRNTNIDIYLNIPILRNINEEEAIDFYNFSKNIGIKCRFLELLPVYPQLLKYYLDIEDFMKQYFKDFEFISKYEYGISKYRNDNGDLIYTCRSMCFDRRCKDCLKNHYLHIVPKAGIKPCMLRKKIFAIDKNSISNSINNACNYLSGISNIPVYYEKLFNKTRKNDK